MEVRRWICTTRCMENKTRPPLEGLNHSSSTGLRWWWWWGGDSPREYLGAFMRGGNLTTLPGTAHHALEFCSGFSRSGTQRRHPRQNNMANVVSWESCKKKKKNWTQCPSIKFFYWRKVARKTRGKKTKIHKLIWATHVSLWRHFGGHWGETFETI